MYPIIYFLSSIKATSPLPVLSLMWETYHAHCIHICSTASIGDGSGLGNQPTGMGNQSTRMGNQPTRMGISPPE